MSTCPLAISKYLPKCPVTTLKYVVGAAVAVKVVTTTVAFIKAANRRKAAAKRMQEQEPNTVALFMFPKPKLVESPVSLAGPAAAVETFLRLFKVKYTVVESMDTEESPSGRLPYAEINGKQIPESSFIINAAKVLPGVKLPTLTAEQHAIGHSVRRVVTETFRLGFYRYLMVDRPDICVSRFVDFKALSYPSWLLNILIRRMFRPNVIKMLNLHGYGDLWYDEYHREMMDDLNAVEALLSRSSFLFGEEPSEYDCYVFGFLYQLRAMPSAASYPALDHVRTSPVIKAYLDRIVKLAGYTELPVV